MAEVIVPRYFLTQLMPHGLRTGKKPVWVIPVEEKHYTYRNRAEESARAFAVSMFIPFDKPHVFQAWEYRFWGMAMIDNAPYTECRCCGAMGGPSPATRKRHHEQGGCTTRLIDAFTLLLKDKLCVICDCKTARKKWGVPLCSNACEQAWCESEICPVALSFALKLVSREV